ncbi:MAG: hypothetical protein ACLSUS_05530 [Opitutales bacterium]
MKNKNILLSISFLILSIFISISIIHLRTPIFDYLLHPQIILSTIDTSKINLTEIKIKKYYDNSLDIKFVFEYLTKDEKDTRTRTIRFVPNGRGGFLPGKEIGG